MDAGDLGDAEQPRRVLRDRVHIVLVAVHQFHAVPPGDAEQRRSDLPKWQRTAPARKRQWKIVGRHALLARPVLECAALARHQHRIESPRAQQPEPAFGRHRGARAIRVQRQVEHAHGISGDSIAATFSLEHSQVLRPDGPQDPTETPRGQ